MVHAIVDCPKKDVLNGAAFVMRSTVFANMLDAPIAKLALGEEVDLC